MANIPVLFQQLVNILWWCIFSLVFISSADGDDLQIVLVETGRLGLITCPPNQFVNIKSAGFDTARRVPLTPCDGVWDVKSPLAKKCWQGSKCVVTVRTAPTGLPQGCKWIRRPLTVTYTCEVRKFDPSNGNRLHDVEAAPRFID
ncbi:hypothetical protein BV898_01237 [Hypsibius exemplaris]|uniref:SUEL-type lectin domain-containing protein n=1 Tax=Hypsibius exemplaris TaxID=2072580 RepID=A0A1W0XC61_HYPEX|nr:hypothetical protein BV898_01237 [Hypsibius exemplaris]